MSRGRLRPEDAHRIQINFPYLLDEMDQVDDLANYMYSKKVFTLDDCDEIKNASPNTRKKKVDVFLQRLMHGGQGAYPIFIEALDSIGSSHIVTQLNSNTEPGPQGDTDEIPIRPGAEGKTMREKDLNAVAGALGKNWESLMIHLGVRPNQVEQIKMQHTHSPIMQIFTCLNKWRQMNGHQATAAVLRDALVKYGRAINMDFDAIRAVFQNL